MWCDSCWLKKEELECCGSAATQISVSSGNENMRQNWDLCEHLKCGWLPSRTAARMKPNSANPVACFYWSRQCCFFKSNFPKVPGSQHQLGTQTAVGFAWLIFNNCDVFYAPHGCDQISEVFLEFLLLAKMHFTGAQEIFACWHYESCGFRGDKSH